MTDGYASVRPLYASVAAFLVKSKDTGRTEKRAREPFLSFLTA